MNIVANVKNINNGFFKLYATSFAFSIISVSVTAQKIPKIQEVSVRAPANVKIDGKPTEWGNKYSAYNNATEVFYTIANDDANLYLVIHADKHNIIKKIIMGGVTFTINPSLKKEERTGLSVCFPALDRKAAGLVTQYLDKKPDILPDTALMSRNADTLMQMANQRANDNLKYIKVWGIKDLEDSVISVYNEQGVHAAALFDKKMAFTYELALPLKYLGLSAENLAKFSYHIKLNGLSAADKRHVLEGTGKISISSDGVVTSTFVPLNQDLIAATDLWGEYTIAKK